MKRTNPPSVEPANPVREISGSESAEESQGSASPEEFSAQSTEPQSAAIQAEVTEKHAAAAPTAVAAEIVIPPILLEGDEPAHPTGAVSPENPATQVETNSTPELPESYGTGRLLLAARDPECVYAHWDLNRQERQKAEDSGGGALSLRIHQDSLSGPVVSEEQFPIGRSHSFVSVAAASGPIVAQLGYYSPEGLWTPVASSDTVEHAAAPAPQPGVVEFATLEFPLTGTSTPGASPAMDQLIANPLTAEAAPAHSSTKPGTEITTALAPEFPLVRTAPAAPELPAEAFADPVVFEADLEEAQLPLPGPGETRPIVETPWTPDREQMLSQLITRSVLRHKRIGSAEFDALLKAESNWAGLLPSAEVSSHAGPQPAAAPGFWLNINAEVVVYGATEPDSVLRIAGQTLPLGPDGSFSFRFALPDGSYSLPVEAVSKHGDVRRAELQFHRGTRYSGQVGVHPQNPRLSVPGSGNPLQA
ncbi:MAG TPA: DUF4912 domain-containing protein [Verrucomicrobiae bacterium]|nr:DUF4912 domain-containing protein [Verrucomicrobiae bacterium]